MIRPSKTLCLSAAHAVLLLLSACTAPDALPGFDALPARPELPDPFLMLDGSRIQDAEAW